MSRHESVAAVSPSIWFWIAFHIGVFIVIAIDLLWQKRTPQPVTMVEAATWSAIWISLSLGFNALIWYVQGSDQALDFFTGYVIEYSLSVDNIFIFVLIFSYFQVPPQSQHRALVWGIVGALVMRGAMIAVGVALVERFDFILYIFGAFLLLTGIRMLTGGREEIDFEKNWMMRVCRRTLPLTRDFYGRRFAVRIDGRLLFTPLFLVLVVIDVMDLVFAVDSIPAVFAITTDRFIVYTSNICAVLGLRSLYFLLAGLMDRFVYLKTGLAIILSFVGIKMIAAPYLHIGNGVSLLVIVLVLAVTISMSMIATRERRRN